MAFESLFFGKNWFWVSSVSFRLILLAVLLKLLYMALYSLYRALCYVYRVLCRLYQNQFPKFHEEDDLLASEALGEATETLDEATETRLGDAPQEQLDDYQTALGQLSAEDEALYQRLHRRFQLLASENSIQDLATQLRDTQQDYLDTHEMALRKVRANQLNYDDRKALRKTRSALDNARKAHYKALETRRDARGGNDWNFSAAPGPLRIRTYIGVDVNMTRSSFVSVSKGHEDAVRRACAIAANKHNITHVLIRSIIHNSSGEVYDGSHITCNFYDPNNIDLYRAVHVYIRYADIETGELSDVLDANIDIIPRSYAWERVMYEKDSFLDPKYQDWQVAYGTQVWAEGKSWSAAESNDWHNELDRLEDITEVDGENVRRETRPDEEQQTWQDEGADWQGNSDGHEQEDGQDGWLGTLHESEPDDLQESPQVEN